MLNSKLDVSDKFSQAMIEEIEKMMRDLEQKQGLLTEDYMELYHRIKAKTATVEREQAEMVSIFSDFVKKHEAGGRPVFIKKINFYLDSLDKHDYKNIRAALKEEIQALKREMEERNKIELVRIKNF